MLIFSPERVHIFTPEKVLIFTPEKVIVVNANYSEDGKVTNMKHTGATFEDHNAETFLSWCK